MLEILLLFGLCKHLGVIAKDKGLKPIKWQLVLVAVWVGVEITVSTSAYLAFFVLYGEEAETLSLSFYFLALIGSAISAWLIFTYLKNLPPQKSVIIVPNLQKD